MNYTKIRFVVTKNDIDKGIRGDMTNCAITLSICRRLRLNKNNVCTTTAKVYINDKINTLPEKCITFIKDFDAGKPVKPFQFTLNILSS